MSKNWCNDPKPADNNHKIIFVPSFTVAYRTTDFTKKAGKYSKTTYPFLVQG